MNSQMIIILGGRIINGASEWRTSNLDEADNFGIIGDRLRVVAGSLLYRNNPDNLVMAIGGQGQLKNLPDVPPISEIIKKELIELGVPSENILTESESGNTWQQLMIIKKIINKKEVDKSIIVSNEYHLERIRALIGCDSVLSKIFESKKLELRAAEKILLQYQPKIWEKTIEEAYRGEKMKQRIETEKRGVAEIKSKKYKFQ